MRNGPRVTTVMALACVACAAAAAAAGDRIVVDKADDLPRHTYTIEGTASGLVADRDAVLALAAEVQRDLKADLEAYEIPDRTTLKGYYRILRTIAFLQSRTDDALALGDTIRGLEDKEAAQLTDGLTMRAIVASDDDPDGFERALEADVARLPYEIVQDELKQTKGTMEIISRNLVLDQVQATLDPMVAKTGGELSKDVATGLIGSHYVLTEIVPLKDRVTAVYGRYLAVHAVAKADIWAARDVDVPADASGRPIVAIWDSGVDADIFAGMGVMWTNPDEIPGNGIDDDNNGHVDDVHGIAYDLESNPVPELLLPLGELMMPRGELQDVMKGLGDTRANIDSPEASLLKRRVGALTPDEVRPFLEEVTAYSHHSHGTHVAGIAAAGNPHVRLLGSRFTFDHRMVPDPPTVAEAYRGAAAAVENVEYFKAHGVRVVNMSWGGSISGGDRLKFSGTSMSSPNVANLAAKLLAVDPTLTPLALRELIEAGDRTVRLVNPKRAMELLGKRLAES